MERDMNEEPEKTSCFKDVCNFISGFSVGVNLLIIFLVIFDNSSELCKNAMWMDKNYTDGLYY